MTTLQRNPRNPEEKELIKRTIESDLAKARNEREREALLSKVQEYFEALSPKKQDQIKERLAGVELVQLLIEKTALREEVEKGESKEKKPILTQVGDSMEVAAERIFPVKWTENMSRGEKIAAVGAASAGTVVAGIFALKAAGWVAEKLSSLFGMTVNTTTKVSGGIFKGGLIVGAGLLAFLGFSGAAKAIEKKVTAMTGEAVKQIGNAVGDASDKLTKTVDEAKQAATSIKEDLSKGVQETIDDAVDEKVSPVLEDVRESVARVEEHQQEVEEQQKAEEQERLEAIEITEQQQEEVKFAMAKTAILFLHPSGNFVEHHFYDAISKNEDNPMYSIFSCASGSLENVQVNLNDTVGITSAENEANIQSRRRATEHLVRICYQQKLLLQKLHPDDPRYSDEALSTMSLREYISIFTEGWGSMASTFTQLRNFDGDWSNFAESFDPEALFVNSGDLDGGVSALYEKYGELLAEDQGKQFTAAMLFEAVKSVGDHKLTPQEFLEDLQQIEKERELTSHENVLRHVCIDMRNPDGARFVMPFFHGLSPYTDFKTNEIEGMQQIVNQRMPLSMIVRLYLYREMMRNKNITGLILAQSDVLRYFARPPYESTWMQKQVRAVQLGRLTGKITNLSNKEAWEEFTDQFEALGVSIPPEMFEKSREWISYLTKGGVQKLPDIIGVPLGAGLTAMGWMIENPKISVTTVGAVGTAAMIAGNAGIDQNSLNRGMQEWRSRVNRPRHVFKAADRLGRRINPLAFHEATVRRAANAYEGIYDAFVRVGKANVLDPKLDKLYRSLNGSMNDAVIHVHQPTHWNRVADLLEEAGETEAAAQARILGQNNMKARKMRLALNYQRFYRTGWKKPVFWLGRQFSRGYDFGRETLRRPIRNVRGLRGWQRVGYVANVGLHAFSLKSEMDALEHEKDQVAEIKDHLDDVMSDLRERLSQDPNFIQVDSQTYKHRESGIKVSINVPSELEDFLDGRVDIQEFRRNVRAGGLAASALYAPVGTKLAQRLATRAAMRGALMGAKLVGGPLGLFIIGVEIGCDVYAYAREQEKMRKFLADVPPWLLLRLNIPETVKQNEYDILDKSSSWMLSDAFSSLDDSDKPGIREKILFQIFTYDLVKYSPEVLSEITAGIDNPVLMNAFYDEDFKKFILPAFSAFLFEGVRSDSVSWRQVQEQDIQRGNEWYDPRTVLLPPDATMVDVREAMRKASVLYLQHIREKRYAEQVLDLQEARSSAEEYRANLEENDLEGLSVDELLEPEFVDMVEQMGDVKVFGAALSEVQEHVAGADKTRAQLVLAKLHDNLIAATGDTRAEKLRSEAGLFTVSTAGIPGLSGDVNITNGSDVYGWVGDKAVQMQLEQAIPETFREFEAEQEFSWSEHVQSLRPSQITGVNLDGMRYSLLAGAANNVLQENGRQPIHGSYANAFEALDSEIGLFLGLARNRERVSSAKAGYVLSKEGASVIETERAEQRRQHLKRDKEIEEEFYGRYLKQPVVLTNGYCDPALCGMLKWPQVDKNLFKREDLQAVIFEGSRLKRTGHRMVLATYVYGDIEAGEINILQASAATSALANVTSSGSRGATVAYSLSEALKKPGIDHLLENTRTSVSEQTEEIRVREEARKKRDAEREARKQEREKEWRENVAPEEFLLALEKADNTPDVYHLIGRNSYLMLSDGKYIVYQPHKYFDGPSVSAGSGKELKTGRHMLQPSGKNLHRFATHKSKEAALEYYQEGTKSSYWMNVGSIAFAKTKIERMRFLQQHICKPVTRDVHDVRRIIDLFPHEVNNPRFFGKVRLHGMELKQELGYYYEQIEKDVHRETFLTELFAQLRAADGVTAASHSSIFNWFKRHQKMFGIES